MRFTHKRFKNNKPNEHWKEHFDEGEAEGKDALNDTEFVNVYSNDFSDMVDDESDENHDRSFDFTTTAAATIEMANMNDKYRRMLALPPLDYRVLRYNDAAFILNPDNPNKNISWEKGLLPYEALPTDLYASKYDDSGDFRGYYALLVRGNIPSDSQIKYALLQDKSTFHRI